MLDPWTRGMIDGLADRGVRRDGRVRGVMAMRERRFSGRFSPVVGRRVPQSSASSAPSTTKRLVESVKVA